MTSAQEIAVPAGGQHNNISAVIAVLCLHIAVLDFHCLASGLHRGLGIFAGAIPLRLRQNTATAIRQLWTNSIKRTQIVIGTRFRGVILLHHQVHDQPGDPCAP